MSLSLIIFYGSIAWQDLSRVTYSLFGQDVEGVAGRRPSKGQTGANIRVPRVLTQPEVEYHNADLVNLYSAEMLCAV